MFKSIYMITKNHVRTDLYNNQKNFYFFETKKNYVKN